MQSSLYPEGRASLTHAELGPPLTQPYTPLSRCSAPRLPNILHLTIPLAPPSKPRLHAPAYLVAVPKPQPRLLQIFCRPPLAMAALATPAARVPADPTPTHYHTPPPLPDCPQRLGPAPCPAFAPSPARAPRCIFACPAPAHPGSHRSRPKPPYLSGRAAPVRYSVNLELPFSIHRQPSPSLAASFRGLRLALPVAPSLNPLHRST